MGIITRGKITDHPRPVVGVSGTRLSIQPFGPNKNNPGSNKKEYFHSGGTTNNSDGLITGLVAGAILSEIVSDNSSDTSSDCSDSCGCDCGCD